jgi:type III restriction enzyme
MARQTSDFSYAFYELLWDYYSQNRKKIRSRYNDLTKKFLDYNDSEKTTGAFLRKPQFEALEMYVFIKEFMDNQQVYEMFDDWRKRRGRFEDRSYYSITKGGQYSLMDDFTETQTNALFKQMKKYREDYPNYIYALTMGLGKTILIATCIFYEFLLANKYPKDKRFVHNALVFAPDKTVLESLREIVTFDKTLVVPKEYARVLDANVKIHFLEDTGTSLNTLDDSDFNIVISNTQKIVLKKKRTADTAVETLFAAAKTSSLLSGIYGKKEDEADDDDVVDEASMIENQRFLKLTRLRQLGVYVDEAHHLFGAQLEKSLRSKTAAKTSLRDTINILAERTSIVACYNYTGTPYVDRQPLPDVVYAYGLADSIRKGYLKEVTVQGFENVKTEDFLRQSITTFWERYGGQTYEGLNPKLAIFASTVPEAQDEVRPLVERIVAELGLEASKILVNVGDPKITKDEDIRLFNELDIPGSAGNEKEFVILVGKGKEGWNCRSLFGVAMFRSPRSKVFVLQATMRCLRQITDQQQRASVFLSKDNFDILDAELEKNFNIDLDGLQTRNKTESVAYQVRMVPPERKITLKQIWREYFLEEHEYVGPLDFGLDNLDVEKYRSILYEKSGLASNTTAKQHDITAESKRTSFSAFMLVGEISRYMNLNPLLVERILRESKDGIEKTVEMVSHYNQIIDDVIIPTIFKALYTVSSRSRVEDKELVLLREPADKGYWEFRANPDLVVMDTTDRLTESERAKTFHADTYCFDSKPERECFWQYVESDRVKEVYFTGMFTANQGDLAIQYFDSESKRIRSYYPDFVAVMCDGSLQLIEVKGDNMIDDDLVKVKAAAAQDMASLSDVDYIMYPSSRIMETNVLEPTE